MVRESKVLNYDSWWTSSLTRFAIVHILLQGELRRTCFLANLRFIFELASFLWILCGKFVSRNFQCFAFAINKEQWSSLFLPWATLRPGWSRRPWRWRWRGWPRPGTAPQLPQPCLLHKLGHRLNFNKTTISVRSSFENLNFDLKMIPVMFRDQHLSDFLFM